MGRASLWTAIGFLAMSVSARGDGDQRFADIGDLKLESGQTLAACRVGYRTFGKLNGRKDNAVLVPTWYLGTTGDLAGSFVRGGLVDASKYFVIAVDALGNGVSTSPSNSRRQHDEAFPAISVRDMVESQYRMLGQLGVAHLHAVVGISMGGMQTFQWIFSHPDFVDRAVPIVGSPRPTSYDLMYYAAGYDALRRAETNLAAREPLIREFADFFWLALHTPSWYVEHTKREDAAASLRGFEAALLKWDVYDMACDMDSIARNDAYAPFGEDESRAAATVRAKVLAVVATQDHCVNPAPALVLAKRLGGQTIVLEDNDGHQSPGAEMGRLSKAIDEFLAGN